MQLRSAFTVVVALLSSSLAFAEGVERTQHLPSTLTRINGATTLRLMPGGGLLSLGGSRLRMLQAGNKTWEVLLQQPGDNLYRVAVDKSDRVLAAWEQDPVIHLFVPGTKRHTTFPKPEKPSADTNLWRVEHLGFLPNGRDALVYMEGQTNLTLQDVKIWNYRLNFAYRVALDGKTPPELLYQVDSGVRLDMDDTLGVFLIPENPDQRCEDLTCNPVAAVVAYDVTDDGVRQTTLVSSAEMQLSNAHMVWGNGLDPVVMLLSQKKNERKLLSWRRGDPKARILPFPKHRFSAMRPFATKTGEVVDLISTGDSYLELEMFRYPLAGGEPTVTRLTYPRGPESSGWNVHAAGMRSNGTLWMHWGDYLVLFPKNKPPVRYDLEPLLQRRTEWADADVYVPKPEVLWVGLDGRGRDFVRVSFEEAEKKAKPFPLK